MAFKPGNKLGKGGVRPGSGRSPDWVKKKCQEMGTSPEAWAFMQSVVNGSPVEEKIQYEGQKPITVFTSASVDARVKAWNSVMDRGFGKALQGVEMSGSVATKYVINVVPVV